MENAELQAQERAERQEAKDIEQVNKPDQILNESDLQKTEKKSGKKGGSRSNKPQKSGIEHLRARVETLRKQLETQTQASLQRSLETPKVILKEDSIDLEYSTRHGLNTYKDVQPVVQGDIARCLLPALKPLVKVFQAAIQCQNLRNLKQAHTRDNDGRLTKDILTHDGKAVFTTNPIDDLRYTWKAISASKACMDALKKFHTAVQALDFSNMPGVTTRQTHSDTYDSGEFLSDLLKEYKSSSSASDKEDLYDIKPATAAR